MHVIPNISAIDKFDYIQWIEQWSGLNTYITLATHPAEQYRTATRENASLDKMHRSLKTFDAMLAKQMLGSKWIGHPARLEGSACLEHLDTNPHWHIVLKRDPVVMPIGALAHQADKIWRKLFPSGNADTGDVRDIADCASYNFKAISGDRLESHVVAIPCR